MRLIVQNLNTGRFLAPDSDNQPEWILSLAIAIETALDDYENAQEMGQEYTEIGERFQIIDLDH